MCMMHLEFIFFFHLLVIDSFDLKTFVFGQILCN